MSLPAPDLRSNRGTWAIPTADLPALSERMLRALAVESFDPAFRGQKLCTYYFDTDHSDLRRARVKGDRYLTLRLRSYESRTKPIAWALSAKTESEKWRQPIEPDLAVQLMDGTAQLADQLPANLLARLQELAEGAELVISTEIKAQRYAVEDKQDRLTLDVDVHTDTGKTLPYAVLEHKSTTNDGRPAPLLDLTLHPLKISKFLWATQP